MQRFKEEIKDEKLKQWLKLINFYANNIDKNSKPLKGTIKFLEWAKNTPIFV